jgi:hypothetical protein
MRFEDYQDSVEEMYQHFKARMMAELAASIASSEGDDG